MLQQLRCRAIAAQGIALAPHRIQGRSIPDLRYSGLRYHKILGSVASLEGRPFVRMPAVEMSVLDYIPLEMRVIITKTLT